MTMTNGFDADRRRALMGAIFERVDTKICKTIRKGVDSAPTIHDAELVAVHAAVTAVGAAIGVVAAFSGISDVSEIEKNLDARVTDLIFGELGLDAAEGRPQ
jgi:hypothetical protein